MKYVLAYLVIINALSFLFMRLDKQKAKKHKRRIPEAVLLGISAIGGSFGTLAAMEAFRHKTKHQEFFLGIPLMMAVHIVILVLILL